MNETDFIKYIKNIERRLEYFERSMIIRNLTMPSDGSITLPVVTTDPVSPNEGQMWYNSTTDDFKKYENGAIKLLSQSSFGSMYADEISQSVTISVAGTFAQIGGSFSQGEVSEVTFQNSRELVVAKAGIYLMSWGLSLKVGVANQEVMGDIMVNGSAIGQASQHSVLSTANKDVQLSGSCIYELSADDIVSLAVTNETSTNSVIMEHGQLTIHRIGI